MRLQTYNMTSEKIKQSLIDLGYKLLDRGSYWQTNAIFRNGDNKTAIQIYKDTGVWKDYVQGSQFSPFQRLVEITLGTNDSNEVKKYLEEELDSFYTRKASEEKIEMEEIYPPDCLDKLLPHYKFYNDKGISDETLKFFKGGYATTGQLNKRFVFPIYNEHKQIHGFSGRDMIKAENRPKWKHIGKKKNWVYPLHVDESTRESINNSKQVILVESIGDLLNLREFGLTNCLVTFGLDLSPKLICALVALAPGRVIFSFNNDSNKNSNRGLEACMKNYLKLLTYFEPDKLAICLPTANDFGDMNEDDFKTWKKKLLSIKPQDQWVKILSSTDPNGPTVSKISKPILKNRSILIDRVE
jgi:hypothetical protein